MPEIAPGITPYPSRSGGSRIDPPPPYSKDDATEVVRILLQKGISCDDQEIDGDPLWVFAESRGAT